MARGQRGIFANNGVSHVMEMSLPAGSARNRRNGIPGCRLPLMVVAAVPVSVRSPAGIALRRHPKSGTLQACLMPRTLP
jgi:hypothetical protein